MPYTPNEERPNIPDKARDYLKPAIEELAKRIIEVHKSYGYAGAFAGQLNFSVTTLLCLLALDESIGMRYWTLDLLPNTLSDVQKEFYRRVVAPYEDKQIAKNGDIPEYLELLNRIK